MTHNGQICDGRTQMLPRVTHANCARSLREADALHFSFPPFTNASYCFLISSARITMISTSSPFEPRYLQTALIPKKTIKQQQQQWRRWRRRRHVANADACPVFSAVLRDNRLTCSRSPALAELYGGTIWPPTCAPPSLPPPPPPRSARRYCSAAERDAADGRQWRIS